MKRRSSTPWLAFAAALIFVAPLLTLSLGYALLGPVVNSNAFRRTAEQALAKAARGQCTISALRFAYPFSLEVQGLSLNGDTGAGWFGIYLSSARLETSLKGLLRGRLDRVLVQGAEADFELTSAVEKGRGPSGRWSGLSAAQVAEWLSVRPPAWVWRLGTVVLESGAVQVSAGTGSICLEGIDAQWSAPAGVHSGRLRVALGEQSDPGRGPASHHGSGKPRTESSPAGPTGEPRTGPIREASSRQPVSRVGSRSDGSRSDSALAFGPAVHQGSTNALVLLVEPDGLTPEPNPLLIRGMDLSSALALAGLDLPATGNVTMALWPASGSGPRRALCLDIFAHDLSLKPSSAVMGPSGAGPEIPGHDDQSPARQADAAEKSTAEGYAAGSGRSATQPGHYPSAAIFRLAADGRDATTQRSATQPLRYPSVDRGAIEIGLSIPLPAKDSRDCGIQIFGELTGSVSGLDYRGRILEPKLDPLDMRGFFCLETGNDLAAWVASAGDAQGSARLETGGTLQGLLARDLRIEASSSISCTDLNLLRKALAPWAALPAAMSVWGPLAAEADFYGTPEELWFQGLLQSPHARAQVQGLDALPVEISALFRGSLEDGRLTRFSGHTERLKAGTMRVQALEIDYARDKIISDEPEPIVKSTLDWKLRVEKVPAQALVPLIQPVLPAWARDLTWGGEIDLRTAGSATIPGMAALHASLTLEVRDGQFHSGDFQRMAEKLNLRLETRAVRERRDSPVGVKVNLAASSGEIVYGGLYGNLTLNKPRVLAQGEILPDGSLVEVRHATVSLDGVGHFLLKGRLSQGERGRMVRAEADMQGIRIRNLFEQVLHDGLGGAYPALGEMTGSGMLDLNLTLLEAGGPWAVRGGVRLEDASFSYPARRISAKGVRADVPFSLGHQAALDQFLGTNVQAPRPPPRDAADGSPTEDPPLPDQYPLSSLFPPGSTPAEDLSPAARARADTVRAHGQALPGRLHAEEIVAAGLPVTGADVRFLLNRDDFQLLEPLNLEVAGGRALIRQFGLKGILGGGRRGQAVLDVWGLDLPTLSTAFLGKPVGGSLTARVDHAGFSKLGWSLKGDVRLDAGDGFLAVQDFELASPAAGKLAGRCTARAVQVPVEVLLARIMEKPFTGLIQGELGAVSISSGKLTTQGGLELETMGGTVTISGIQGGGLQGPNPFVQADLNLVGINLYTLTSPLEFGRISGVVNGRVSGLKVTTSFPYVQAFRLDLETVKRRGIPQRIDATAVRNLSRIGGSNALAAALSSGLYRYFDEYYYSKMGVHASLKKGWLELHGIPVGDKEYLIVQALRIPNISMPIQFLTPEPKIRFKNWLGELASIGSNR